jgi:hypothetical protein
LGDQPVDEFTPLERAVMDKLLEADDPIVTALRAQWERATLADRQYTGVGFYTGFHVPIELQIKPGTLDTALHAAAEVEGLEAGVGFVLFVGAGFIQFLEGFSYSPEKWPDEIDSSDSLRVTAYQRS